MTVQREGVSDTLGLGRVDITVTRANGEKVRMSFDAPDERAPLMLSMGREIIEENPGSPFSRVAGSIFWNFSLVGEKVRMLDPLAYG